MFWVLQRTLRKHHPTDMDPATNRTVSWNAHTNNTRAESDGPQLNSLTVANLSVMSFLASAWIGKVIFSKHHCSASWSLFLAFHTGSAATMLYVRCIITASRGCLITKHSIQVSRGMQEGDLGQGLYIASWWWAILQMGSQMEWLSFRTAENDHQSCRPEQRGFIIVCGSCSVTLGVMRNQIELLGKRLKPGMNA